MVRIKCKSCGDTGYTASPECLTCRCGGRFKVVPESRRDKKPELDETEIELFSIAIP